MKILVTGNLGYVGSEAAKHIKQYIPYCFLTGMDSGLFMGCTTSSGRIGDTYYDQQIFKDLRDIQIDDLRGYDVIVHLAAVSNDPIGNDFEEATNDINMTGSCRLFRLALTAGIDKFIFASSCSMYGAAGDSSKTELDTVHPLTAYARSKAGFEQYVRDMSNEGIMDVTCLRFATACGVSDRLRLDLVLNDFVASASKFGVISILSDGSPWRPLIDVADMAKAVVWAIMKPRESTMLSINIGSNSWNFQVIRLAELVAEQVPGTMINTNPFQLQINVHIW